MKICACGRRITGRHGNAAMCAECARDQWRHYLYLPPARHQVCKVCRRAYGVEHAEERRVYNARYSAEHREEERAQHARYRAENPEVFKAAALRHKARKQELSDTLTTAEWQQCLAYFGNKCAYCGKEADFWTVLAPDHYIALKDPRPDNPGTVKENVLCACHARPGVPAGVPCCNNSKLNKDPVEWLEQRFGKRRTAQILKRIEAYFEWVSSSRAD